MKRILLLFLVAALVCFTIAQDCPLKSGTPKQLKKCLNQVKYNKAQAKQIIDKLKTIFSVSTLTNLYKSNVAPYFQKVDIIKKLDQVAKKKWKNYFDFFATLQGLISSLNDGHVTLSIPQGYRDYHLIRPYTVNFGIENEDLYGTLQNCMKSCVLCQKKTNATLAAVCDELKPYVGKRVVSINGLTPYKYFLKMADSFGFHPDLGGRFSYFIQDLSDVFMWQHYLKKHADVEKLKFEDGTTVNVPIVANNRRQATSAKIKASIVAYNAALQNAVAKVLGPATSSSSARSIEDEEFIDVHENIQNGPNPGPEFVSATTERDLETETVVNNCVQQATYPLGNTKATLLFCNVATLGETVAVLIFPTFSTEQLDGPNVFKNTINAMRQNSIKRIMIDVSGNGGGFVGLAFVAMTAITGRNPSDFLLPFSMRKTDGLINYINVKTPNTLSRVFDQNGKNYSNPEFAQYATTTFPEDSSSSYFEPFYYFNSPSFQTRQQMYNFVYKLNGSSFSDFPQSPAEEIIVLTDGRCASSCSIFTTGLQVLAARDSTANIRVVQYSGQPNKPFDVSNIACNIITAGTPGFPSMGFKILRVHNSPNTTAGVFRQFTRFNPDYRLELWPSKKNKPLIYSNALQYFGFSQKLQPPRRKR